MLTIGTMKTALAALTVTGMVMAAAPAYAQSPVIAAQTAGGAMQTVFPPNGNTPFSFSGVTVMPGTSPAIAAVPGYPYAIAFQSTAGQLWVGWPDEGLEFNLVNTGFLMSAGTSPSIAKVSPDFKVAFQSNLGELWTYQPSAGGSNTHLGMKASTSPSITSLSLGGYEIAFQASTGVLWTVSPAGVGAATSATMLASTSPGIVGLSSGGFEIAFQCSTGELCLMDSSGVSLDTMLGMMAGTSPGVAGLSSGGFEVAFQANTGILWTVLPNGSGGAVGTSTGLAMMSGTSPAIAALGTGAEIAFQANTGVLWYVSASGVGSPTTQTVQTGSSPGITVI